MCDYVTIEGDTKMYEGVKQLGELFGWDNLVTEKCYGDIDLKSDKWLNSCSCAIDVPATASKCGYSCEHDVIEYKLIKLPQAEDK